MDLSLEPKEYNCAFLCKSFLFKFPFSNLWIHKFDIYSLFVRNIPRPQGSFTWCQFGNTGLWISWIRPPSQYKRGGVHICFKNSFPIKILNIHYLQESISFELQVDSKICEFVSLYRSPSQTSDEFEKFTDNCELALDTLAESNSDLVVVLEDLNIKFRN